MTLLKAVIFLSTAKYQEDAKRQESIVVAKFFTSG
jgi:hypothetical protein